MNGMMRGLTTSHERHDGGQLVEPQLWRLTVLSILESGGQLNTVRFSGL